MLTLLLAAMRRDLAAGKPVPARLPRSERVVFRDAERGEAHRIGAFQKRQPPTLIFRVRPGCAAAPVHIMV